MAIGPVTTIRPFPQFARPPARDIRCCVVFGFSTDGISRNADPICHAGPDRDGMAVDPFASNLAKTRRSGSARACVSIPSRLTANLASYLTRLNVRSRLQSTRLNFPLFMSRFGFVAKVLAKPLEVVRPLPTPVPNGYYKMTNVNIPTTSQVQTFTGDNVNV